ncbi:WXG100 family type VII secretion target [Nocardiaceae bacterium NPDC056970]
MDAVLRPAAGGLQFFATFVPRAAFVAERAGTGDRFPTYDEIEARYFEQSDIRLDALAADIDVVTRVAADIDGRCDDQERERSAVGQAWRGQASDTADAHLAEHLTRAARLQQDLDDVRCALVEADRVLRDVATRKAEWVASLDPTRACGRTVAEVDAVVETAVRFGAAADDAANWAVDVFLARVRDTTAQFVDLCDAAEFTVDEVFRGLDAAFCAVDDSAFKAPARIAEVCSGAGAPEPQPCPQLPSAPTTVAACAAVSASPPPTSSLAGLTCAGTGSVGAQVTGAAPAAPAAPTTPAGTAPSVPNPGVAIGSVGTSGTGGSLAIEGAVRAAGAIAGTVAQVALGIVGEVVAEVTAAVRETGSLNLDPGPAEGPGCACDCECSCAAEATEPDPDPEPEPAPPAPAPEPEPDTEPVAATPAPEPAPEPDCPEPAPEPDCPEPAPEPPAPADYCAPTGEAPAEDGRQSSPGTPTPGPAPSNPVRGARPSVGTPSPAIAGTADPTLAEVGSPAPGADDQGVALAEAGAM